MNLRQNLLLYLPKLSTLARTNAKFSSQNYNSICPVYCLLMTPRQLKLAKSVFKPKDTYKETRVKLFNYSHQPLKH